MYALIIHFEIPDSKIHEFDVFSKQLKGWPVYGQYYGISGNPLKRFVLIKNWSSKLEMNSDLKSPVYENLMGAINVLGRPISKEVLETCKQLN